MMMWGYILLAGVVSAAAGAVALGRRRWRQKTAALRATMRAAYFSPGAMELIIVLALPGIIPALVVPLQRSD